MQTERKKVYRSVNGCTVCYVKSGHHPFQNSNKWTKYIQKVFSLNENRTNKVCSSCVKHILKWRRTPKQSRPDLSHIVKTTPPRRPSNRKSQSSLSIEVDSEKKDDNKAAVTNDSDELSSENELDGDFDDAYFETSSPDSNFSEEYIMKQYKDASSQTSFLYPTLTSPQANAFKLPYIDLSKWRQEQICCGVIFRGPSGEVLVDPKWLNPSCSFCDRSCSTPSPPKESKEINIFDEKLFVMISGGGGSFGGSTFGKQSLFSTPPNDRYHYNKSTNASVNEVKLPSGGEVAVQTAQMVQMAKKELQGWASNKVWPFSCFAVQRETNCLSGFVDISPEELRLEAYECKDTGLQAYLVGVQNLTNEVLKRRNQLIKYDDKQLFIEINAQTTGSKTDHFGNKSMLNNQYESSSSGKLFGSSSSSSSSSFFNLNSTSKGIFDMQPSNNNANAFGMQSSNNNTSAFGMQPSNNNANPFGMQSSNNNAGLFNKLTQSSSSGGLFNANEPDKISTVITKSLFSVSSSSENPFKSASSSENPFKSALSSENPFKLDTSLNFFSKNLQSTEKGFFSSGLFGSNSNSSTTGSNSREPSSTDISGGVSSLKNNSMGLFSNSGNGADQKSIFSQVSSQPSTQPSNPFFSSQTSAQSFNPFFSSQVATQVRSTQLLSIYEQLRMYKPIQVENVFQIPPMTSDDVESFKACRFEIGKIPKCPPPIEFC